MSSLADSAFFSWRLAIAISLIYVDDPPVYSRYKAEFLVIFEYPFWASLILFPIYLFQELQQACRVGRLRK